MGVVLVVAENTKLGCLYFIVFWFIVLYYIIFCLWDAHVVRSAAERLIFGDLCSVFQQMQSCGSPGVLVYLLKMRQTGAFLIIYICNI